MITVPAIQRDQEDLENLGAPRLPSAQTFPADLWVRTLHHFPTAENQSDKPSETDINTENHNITLSVHAKINFLTPECLSYSTVRRKQA